VFVDNVDMKSPHHIAADFFKPQATANELVAESDGSSLALKKRGGEGSD
jgi:hypothetical protein